MPVLSLSGEKRNLRYWLKDVNYLWSDQILGLPPTTYLNFNGTLPVPVFLSVHSTLSG
jgi:hypothetical protein